MLAVHVMQQFQRAWHTHRTAADHRIPPAHGLAIGLQEIVRAGGHGRFFAAIEGGERARVSIEIEQERAAADARTLRFDQIQHELDGDHGINRVAAALEDIVARLAGMGVGGRHHELFGGHRRFFRHRDRVFRLIGLR